MSDVEILAMWMHETVRQLRAGSLDDDGEERPYSTPFNEMPEYRRDDYIAVATEMLANPPKVLVDAILAKPTFVDK